ncbi:MAG: hypothetical protein LW822_02610 [Phycisphaeraceae bacterium]|jgi:MYXO-CTERM domain-containing protein|nr:hypothetical protein [Phycisphaeraceae bacterium]
MSGRIVALLAVAGSFSSAALGQSFTPNNLVVSVVDLTTSNNLGRPVSLQQFDLSGPLSASANLSRVFNLPATASQTATTVPNSFVLSGTATSEGLITLSPDRTTIGIGGYNTWIGRGGNTSFTTGSVATTLNFSGNAGTGAAANVPRIVASVPANYASTTYTLMNNTYSGSNFRSAVSNGAGGFILGGTSLTNTPANRLTGGARSYTTGPTSINLTGAQGTDVNAPSLVNTRFVGPGPTAGSIVIATQSSVTSVGSPGLYTVSGGSAVLLPGFAAPTAGSWGPNDFQFLGNTLYIADDGNAGASGTTGGQLGGLQRWDFNGTTWALSYLINQVNTGTANVFAGLRSLTVISDGSANTIYGIDTAGRLVGVVDAGASSVFTTLAVAPAGFAFRGVEMTPGTLVPTPGAAGLLALGGLVAGRRRRAR